MSEVRLSESVQHLQEALESVPDDQPELRERLTKLLEELKQAQQQEHEDHHGLTERTRELIVELDAEHPRTTRVLNQIMVTLSNMGI